MHNSLRRRLQLLISNNNDILGQGTTDTEGVIWKMHSTGVLEIYSPTVVNYVGALNNWNSDWDSLVTEVSISKIKTAGGARSTFINLVNNTTLTTSKEFGTYASGKLNLRYDRWNYKGSLSEWCTGRNLGGHSDKRNDMLPYSGNQYDLYLNGELLSGNVSIPNTAQSGLAKVKNITSVIIQEGATTIQSLAISGCSATSISIPNTVTTLMEIALAGCNLPEILLPESVTTIKQGAFQNSKQVTTIKLSKNLTSMGTYIFNGCSKLTTIDCSECTQVPTVGTNSFTGNSSLQILVPAALYDEWIVTANWPASKIVSV